MTQIGEFTKLKTGYGGRIRTLSLDIAVAVVAAEPSDTENAPDYRVHAEGEEGPEIGAGWKRSSDKAGAFVSIQLDDPHSRSRSAPTSSRTVTTKRLGRCTGRARAIAPRRTDRCLLADHRRAGRVRPGGLDPPGAWLSFSFPA